MAAAPTGGTPCTVTPTNPLHGLHRHCAGSCSQMRNRHNKVRTVWWKWRSDSDAGVQPPAPGGSCGTLATLRSVWPTPSGWSDETYAVKPLLLWSLLCQIQINGTDNQKFRRKWGIIPNQAGQKRHVSSQSDS